MAKAITLRNAERRTRPSRLPLLVDGEHLDRATFHERYEAMPDKFRAELIGGIVHVPASLKIPHGRADSWLTAWLGQYAAETPGTDIANNATLLLHAQAEHQPDSILIVRPSHGGNCKLTEDDYLEGAPELVVQVAFSTERLDLGRRKTDYELCGVREYLVVLLKKDRIEWFVRGKKTFARMKAPKDGIYRSRVFPGLWLDADALFRDDLKRLLAVGRDGIASPEHAAFVAALQAKRIP